MKSLNVYKINPNSANINPLNINRDWMDKTTDNHAYICFPVSLTNTMGWGISFPEDIRFVWDGVSDSASNHVTILSGEKYCYTTRANATISFKTGLIFKTKENVSILSMPVPNLFTDGAQAFTTLISSSFYEHELPLAWMITKKDQEILIPANQPIAAVLPISISELNNFEMHLYDADLPKEYFDKIETYSKAIKDINSNGGWSDFYRKGVDENGNQIGNHEVKKITLSLFDHSKKQ